MRALSPTHHSFRAISQDRPKVVVGMVCEEWRLVMVERSRVCVACIDRDRLKTMWFWKPEGRNLVALIPMAPDLAGSEGF